MRLSASTRGGRSSGRPVLALLSLPLSLLTRGLRHVTPHRVFSLLLSAYALFLVHHQLTGDPLPTARQALDSLHIAKLPASANRGAASLHALGGRHRVVPPRGAARTSGGSTSASLHHARGAKTLRFPVCNGFANQRLSIAYGFVIARKTGRAAVLPALVRDGTQLTDDNIIAKSETAVPFEEVYDVAHFIAAMRHADPPIVALHESEAPAPGLYSDIKLGELTSDAVDAVRTYSYIDHMRVECPLFKLWPGQIDKVDEAVLWAVLAALRPAAGPAHVVNAAAAALRRISLSHAAAIATTGSSAGSSAPVKYRATGHWNFLHLRAEQDWVNHCSKWEAIRDGRVRDNCANNTDTVDEMLLNFGFKPRHPLYVAAYWKDMDPARADRILSRLRAANYTVVTSRDVAPTLTYMHREQAAGVEYALAMRASRFLGNSVSSFGALVMLERRHAGSWAAYYNGGNIPIAQMLPLLHKLPWVFTYNSWSTPYDYMLKGAVRSSLKYNGFKMYCLFYGNTSAPIWHWLNQQGVTMITHTPSWTKALSDKAREHLEENVVHSHLYKRPELLVSTFQRIDIPVVPILDQYTYVFFTDSDVYFRRRVALDDFGLPLPRTVAMSYEFSNKFPYNAGVMLMNLPSLRRTYREFIRFVLDNKHGMYFPSYGPGDQGALNEFYEADLRSHMLSQAFNAKPYNELDSYAHVVHFHGPKPHEYLKYLQTGRCDFHWVCQHGWIKSLCKYSMEWKEHVLDEAVAASVADACVYLDSPTVADLYRQKWDMEGDAGAAAAGHSKEDGDKDKKTGGALRAMQGLSTRKAVVAAQTADPVDEFEQQAKDPRNVFFKIPEVRA